MVLVTLLPLLTGQNIAANANGELHCAALFGLSSCRPHDRVPWKEMKSDWHSCLDNKVGFKVVIA